MACKVILGVQKQTTNLAVLLELGRIPLQNFAIKAAVKNWERIRAGMVGDVLLRSHADARAGGLPWITHIRSILETHGVGHLYEGDGVRGGGRLLIHNLIHKKRCRGFHLDAFRSINNPESKLRTYALFKTEAGCEKYLLEVKNFATRRFLTKFRLSNSVLNIEKGRHTVPKTPKGLRFCPFCPDRVEDEEHFLLGCPVYRVPRGEMTNTVLGRVPLLLRGTLGEQFIELMACENAGVVAKTLQNMFEIREFLTNKPKRLA